MTDDSTPITPKPLFSMRDDQAMPFVKRLVAWIVRGTIISIFVAITGTVAIFTGYAETGEQGASWLDIATQITGLAWGLAMLLLLVLPVPLFMSVRDQRRRKAAMDQ